MLLECPEATTVPLKSQLVPEVARLLDGTHYRALAVLGMGAQGIVLDAEHMVLGKPVVVKVLHDKHVCDKGLIERMRVEAQALARLSSPHLVEVHDFGTLPDGRPYFVMEKLIGRTIRAEVQTRGPFSAAEAIDVARQLLKALEVVHRAGLIHRDIKPDNVFLCETRTPGKRLAKLLDFGIAKVVSVPSGAVVNAPVRTAAGVALGTPRFLSPEQACGDPIDARSDLYSAGALLFWMLAGRDPFAHRTGMTEIMMAHVVEAPQPPSEHAPLPVPRALDEAILKALQKSPGKRFSSAAEFDLALAAVSLDEPAARGPSAGTVRMADAALVRRSPAPGGTIRIAASPNRPEPVAARPSPALRRPRLPWPQRLPRMIRSASVVALVAIGFAGLTVAMLLVARLAGFLG